MHFLLYVCLPVEEAETSIQARRRVCRYLNENQFVRKGRFGGCCDCFCVGGRYSGMLNLLQLRHRHPKIFKRFYDQYKEISFLQEGKDLFMSFFPDYEGVIPVCRDNVPTYGHPDDAQVMNEALYAKLKGGFNEYVTYEAGTYDTTSIIFKNPNVIFTDLGENEWLDFDDAAGPGKHWVVVIDYHE